jgi:hypothetical protein
LIINTTKHPIKFIDNHGRIFKMKKKLLALFIFSSVSYSINAEVLPDKSAAWEGTSYISIVVKLKNGVQPRSQKLILNDPQLTLSPLFERKVLRSSDQNQFAQLDKTYGFDRYLRLQLPEDRSEDIEYINGVITELRKNNTVELVYPESAPVSMDKMTETAAHAAPSGLSYALDSGPNAAVPDFRHLQDYIRSPDEKRHGYYMGGVNRASVNQYPGNDGSNIALVSMENTPWNPQHVNLPDVSFYEGDKTYYSDLDHDTASVGIMAAKDIGTGIKGLAWNTRLGYAKWQVNNLYNMIPRLRAGDVVQIGMQTGGGEVAGCKSSCYVPQENSQAYFDVIKALTDKGVHVIEAAGNGNINLNHSGFNGKFDVKKRDSGAIIAGAFCARDGKKASFSTYGTRVTSSSWGCWDVVTTGYGGLHNAQNAQYTDTFSGTSSANPIIAGVVASLSGIARAEGITVTPAKMRAILQQTGTSLASDDSSRIGTHPDMAKAVEKILELKDEENSSAPVAVAGEDITVASTTDSPRTYQLDGSASRNAESWVWTIVQGAGKFWLQEQESGQQVSSASGEKALALIPANTVGQATYRLTVTGKNGEQSYSDVTVKVQASGSDIEPYNPHIAYPVKCTRVLYKGNVWQNQWYVNVGQEEPGSAGKWGVWRAETAAENGCK